MEKKETIVEAAEEKRVKLEVIGEEVVTTIEGREYIISMFDEWNKLQKHNRLKKHTYLPDLTFEDGIELTWDIVLSLLRDSEVKKISDVEKLRYFLIDSVTDKYNNIMDKYNQGRVDKLYDFFNIVI